MTTPRPVITRMLENPTTGEFVYALIEQMRERSRSRGANAIPGSSSSAWRTTHSYY